MPTSRAVLLATETVKTAMGSDGILESLMWVVPCAVIEIRRALIIRIVQLYFAEFGDGWLTFSLCFLFHKPRFRVIDLLDAHQGWNRAKGYADLCALFGGLGALQ